jgi:hypothetical protein
MTPDNRQYESAEPMSLLPAALRIAERRGMHMPDGLEWSLRVCRADFTNTRNFRWPFPGNWAEAGPAGRDFTTDDPCPQFSGDGLCIARTWRGAASGSLCAEVVLLVGWAPNYVLHDSAEKLRVRRAYVADVTTVAALLAERKEDERANLSGANLSGADLGRVDLSRVSLSGACLRRVDLSGANLSGANLSRADLGGAYLSGVDLSGACLSRVDLRGAYLGGAYLGGADLSGAYLGGVDLSRAYLSGAYLGGAGLSGAYLGGWVRGDDGYARRT